MFVCTEDPDDDDYTGSSTKRKQKRSRPARRPERTLQRDQIVEAGRESSSSESDGEWNANDEGRKRSSRRSRRPKRPKKRQRIGSDESEEPRAGRVNSRTGQTMNYAELDGSDPDFLDSEADRYYKDESEADNVDSIELVVDFRSITADESDEKKRHALVDFIEDSIEIKVKWTGKCHRRNTWHPISELRQFKGIKRVLNYVKRAVESRDRYNDPATAAEELEESHIVMEEHRKNNLNFVVVDRIIAERPRQDDPSQSEYLVKWKKLDYDCCTWEPATELNSEEDMKALDSYAEREQAAASASTKKRFNPFNTRDERPRFKPMSEQPSYLHGEGRTLREYQLRGLNMLAFSWTKRNNVILADEMGLGKTLQTISFLGWLMYERHIPGPFLVVVPLSTSAAWEREFERWLPEMNVVRYCGNAKSREVIRETEFWPSTGRNSYPKFHTLLTTPELLMLDERYISEVRWSCVAVDEAHRLKNESGALHQAMKEMRSANRLLVTGTPLQNSVRELWALLNFLNPTVFPDPVAFEETFSFSALRDPEKVQRLHDTLRPYILRRQKTDVEKSLPKKFYTVLRVGMSSSQQEYYKMFLTKNFAKLNAVGKEKGIGNQITLRNLVMELKKCCNHPFLFPQFVSDADNNLRAYIRGSGKMILLDKLLLRLREKGHRVLIFSQMVSMLDILQDYCRMRGFPHQRLDGTMHNDLRQRAIDHFNEPGSPDYVFLLSTRAGGLGINLATADTVIIFDSDWNPQNDLQAESRAHRIGQTKDVRVFRLLTKESVEEDILERAKRKRVLEHLVIHGVEGDEKQGGKEGAKSFKKEELSAILRFGAEKLFEKEKNQVEQGAQDASADDEKAEERRVMAVDDIDELLSRAPAEDSDEIGAAEPSLGDSLLNAFKWADFQNFEEDEAIEKDSHDAGNLANSAAQAIGNMEDKRQRDFVKAKKQDEEEKEMLAKEGDTEFWRRVIPEEIKKEANGVVLGTRRRRATKAYSEDVTQDRKRRRTRTRSARGALGELNDKEQRSLLKSLRRFGDPRRTLDILKDCSLESRIEQDDARTMLEEALDRAKVTVDEAIEAGHGAVNGSTANGKSSKKKEPAILVDVLGESNVDAADLLKRCNDLQSLRRQIAKCDPDTHFRLPKPPKAPTYGVRWMPQQDALLLVGVNRHGFGNWGKIAEDSELRLSDKMWIAGRHNNKNGAPDSTKLGRRVLTLLRDVANDAKPPPAKSRSRERSKSKSKKTSERKSSVRASDRKRRRHETEEVSERRDRRTSKSKSSKRRKVGRGKSGGSSSGTKDTKSMLITALNATHSSTLDELKLLSTEDSGMRREEKIARTKNCLLKLGRTIEKQASGNETILAELWNYVHDSCYTNLPGHRMSAIYDKLKST